MSIDKVVKKKSEKIKEKTFEVSDFDFGSDDYKPKISETPSHKVKPISTKKKGGHHFLEDSFNKVQYNNMASEEVSRGFATIKVSDSSFRKTTLKSNKVDNTPSNLSRIDLINTSVNHENNNVVNNKSKVIIGSTNLDEINEASEYKPKKLKKNQKPLKESTYVHELYYDEFFDDGKDDDVKRPSGKKAIAKSFDITEKRQSNTSEFDSK